MVRPPEAEPVSAERTLVDTASETSGPPSMRSTQSRTTSNAGIAATTAPKPTRLATLSTGSAEALAPGIDGVAQRRQPAGRLNATSTTMAEASATITDQTPLTDRERDAAPARFGQEARVEARQHHEDIARLTRITTTSGSIATSDAGRPCSLCWP